MDNNKSEFVPNKEYREKINEIIAKIDENYKLRWIYLFLSEKIRNDK